MLPTLAGSHIPCALHGGDLTQRTIDFPHKSHHLRGIRSENLDTRHRIPRHILVLLLQRVFSGIFQVFLCILGDMTQVRCARRSDFPQWRLPSGRLVRGSVRHLCAAVCAHKCRYCSSSPPLAQVYRKVGQRRRRGRNAAQGNGRAAAGGGGRGGRDVRREEKEEKAVSEELKEEEPAKKGGKIISLD